MRFPGRAAMLLSFVIAVPCAISAQESPRLAIRRTTGPITIDGDLRDPGWRDALRVDTFWETKKGDAVPPPVPSVGHLAYDERYFYAAFEFADPHPETIRAPLGDHDAL